MSELKGEIDIWYTGTNPYNNGPCTVCKEIPIDLLTQFFSVNKSSKFNPFVILWNINYLLPQFGWDMCKVCSVQVICELLSESTSAVHYISTMLILGCATHLQQCGDCMCSMWMWEKCTPYPSQLPRWCLWVQTS